ncbi:hypothetical protein BKA58DRAFT_54565 [Alternaria rosae]|uniref:uncharacterized protein n=1 Tax=Alternaria rosae TaxID=1187941 RepID=UPI001E8E2B8D|nr:uncharacterized protein BKA58DRAFT_54565 [Alternaria rosae]KAH6859143.1 hypothetical protein BKA58DRAFT_54565 [Alternaria rosae]
MEALVLETVNVRPSIESIALFMICLDSCVLALPVPLQCLGIRWGKSRLTFIYPASLRISLPSTFDVPLSMFLQPMYSFCIVTSRGIVPGSRCAPCHVTSSSRR